jgi:hypothetical protein
MHDQFAFDYSNVNKTIKVLRRNYRSLKMISDVKQYIKNCHTCKRVKTARDKYHELLNSLSIFDSSWTNIILDFETKLLNNKDYNVILIMIDKSNKMHHYISCINDENETTIEKTTKVFIQHVWKLHELLTTMIFDRDFQFISLVWDTSCKMLRIKTKLFTAFYSKTNDQNKIFNRKMKRYLRAYVNH